MHIHSWLKHSFLPRGTLLLSWPQRACPKRLVWLVPAILGRKRSPGSFLPCFTSPSTLFPLLLHNLLRLLFALSYPRSFFSSRDPQSFLQFPLPLPFIPSSRRSCFHITIAVLLRGWPASHFACLSCPNTFQGSITLLSDIVLC